jgi:hypothetical protein
MRSTTRFDLYTHVHKAIRVLLFDTVETVGCTDFGREPELPATLAVVRRALRLTRLHAEHEDRDIHPLLHRFAPEVAADLEAAHDRFDGIEREIEGCLARMRSATPAARVSLGRRVHEMLGGLVADHLEHMALEESRANRVLWATRTDAELLDVQGRVMAAIGPEEMAEWVELLIPAGNLGERAGLVAALQAVMPPEAFDALTAPGRARLGEAGWSETLAAAEALAAAQAVPEGAAS